MLASLASVLFDGFAYGMLLFLLSVVLSVTLGMMNFVNLAHCSFAMVGGYATVTLMNGFGWPFFATLPAAFLSAAAASVVLERTLYRRLYRASDLDQCLFTIGIVFISVAAAAYLYGTLQQPINTPSYLQGAVELFGMRFGVYRLFLIVTALIVTAILVAALEYTRFGAQVRAASAWTWTAPSRSPSPWAAGWPASAAHSRSRSSASTTRSPLPTWSTCSSWLRWAGSARSAGLSSPQRYSASATWRASTTSRSSAPFSSIS